MSDFAKLFQSETYGQLVVIMQGSVKGRPELRIFMQPAGYCVSSMGLQYEDSDSGWDKCEADFEKIDLAWAESRVQMTFDQLAAMKEQAE